MFKRVGRAFGNIKLTTMIAGLLVTAIIVAVGASSGAIYLHLSGTSQAFAASEQIKNLKIAASVISDLAEVKWAEDGSIAAVQTTQMPASLPDHTMVDAIVRITGESATLFGWDEAKQDFVRLSTTLRGADGERILGTTLGKASAAYAPMIEGKPYFGEAVIVGNGYYTAYQPIVDQAGKVVGVLYVGVDKANVQATIFNTLRVQLVVGACVLVVLAGLGLFIAQRLMAPVPRLAKTMKLIAEGDYTVPVPFITRGNEVGEIARSVEVFRENGLKVSQMTEAEAARIIADETQRRDMMSALQAAFGDVVDAAIAGDFSKRVEASFSDPELNSLAGGVNDLVDIVDRGLNDTGTVLAALADTDLTQRMEGDYQGAFAKLKTDTNAVADKLSDVVGQLKDTSGQLKTATSEILSGANDLSERTTKQAATIEQTSAAMEQLAATVMANAQRAQDASKASSGVTQTAEEGGQVMHQATEAMERITQSSGKISNIIGLIDDIAFQTNLLALNASVEAARAGDAGKGFAVVAIEVRRLAQSAAKASSDVKLLVEQSAGEVRSGSKLVLDAAAKLGTMVTAARSSNELMTGIARESREQAGSIEEVNIAVRTMDEMTQHNAALVEEINAAIEQTEAQASELDRIVDIFTTDAPVSRTVQAEPRREPQPSAGARGLQDRLKTAARSYLTHGNAAVKEDWNEF